MIGLVGLADSCKSPLPLRRTVCECYESCHIRFIVLLFVMDLHFDEETGRVNLQLLAVVLFSKGHF